MKIIGHSGRDYIVLMGAGELCMAAGERWMGNFHGHDLRQNMLPAGGVIDVAKPFVFLSDMAAKQQEAVRAAALLRSLADLMEKGMPDAVFTAAGDSAQEPAT